MTGRLVASAFLASALMLGACGGGGDDQGVAAEVQPSRAVPTQEEPTASEPAKPAETPLADRAAVEKYVRLEGTGADWLPYIRSYTVTTNWVEVATKLVADSDAAEPGLAICRSASLAPHNGEGFMPVRVVSPNGEKIAGNVGIGGVGVCESDV